MNAYTRIDNLKALLLIFWISAYGGFELGFLDLWDDFIPWKKLWLFLGWVVSTLWGVWMAQRTLKTKGYVNLLWLALPVSTIWGILLFLDTPLSRTFLISIVLMAGLSNLWFAFQKRKTRAKAGPLPSSILRQA